MAKKYVVEGAGINCQFGDQTWLIVPDDRHITISNKRMGNEMDFSKDCFGCGGFGTCISTHITLPVTQLYHDALIESKLSSLQQIKTYGGGMPCTLKLGTQWMEAKEDVYIAQYRALLEDSWMFCTHGLGFITFINSGQNENPVDILEEKLRQLEEVVNAYAKEKGLSEKQKNDLINSIVLWNGYSSVPWGSEISQELWDFGIYMEKNHPVLGNFFERGIYLVDPKTGENIDISYLAGLSVALNQNKNIWNIMSETILNDKAAYNAYLEACRLGNSDNALEAMQRFLDYMNSPDYDGSGRYTDYFDVGDEARDIYEEMYKSGCTMDGSYYEPGAPSGYYGDMEEILNNKVEWDELNQEEKDLFILRRTISDIYGEDFADDFINMLYESAGKERP